MSTASRFAAHVQTKVTPQNEAIPGTVANSAGGFSFPVDCWKRLDRFLILGTQGGSYYAAEKALTKENAAAVLECAAVDAERTVKRIVEISKNGRAPKNDPAIFAMALLSTKPEVARYGYFKEAVSEVCRIGTHILHFAAACDALRGWGPSLRKTIAQWYDSKDVKSLAYQVSKYQQRDGWSHRDLLRLSHRRGNAIRTTTGVTKSGKTIFADGPTDDNRDILTRWILRGWDSVGDVPHDDPALEAIWAFERAKRATDAKEIGSLIRTYDLPRECVPTQWLNDPSVWEALLEKMPMTAIVRNLATMTRIGLIAPMSNAVGKILAELANVEKIKKARVHPIAILSALRTYAAGRGVKGQKTWTPVSQIIDALDGAFYTAFQNIVPTGKRWMLALDVSGSMGQGEVAGVPGLTPRIASAAMALVTAATEPQHMFVAFTNGGFSARASLHRNYQSGITPITISPRQRLDDVCRKISEMPFGGTDCALPILYGTEAKIPVDMFVILTDNETWAGNIHPMQALRDYRQKMGIGAKLITVGMVSNGFSIGDPNDAGALDVVGFDSATPALMSDFARE